MTGPVGTMPAVCDPHGRSTLHPSGRWRSFCDLCEQEMLERVLAGEIMASIAIDYGLTRERVRQIIAALDPQASALGRAVRQERAAIAAEVARQVAIAQRTAGLPPCVICWGPIGRMPMGHLAERKHHTCSPECAQLWATTRLHLDPAHRERHHMRVARRAIETGRTGQVVHAVNLLTGIARRDRNRSYPYSPKVAGLLEEVARLREGRTPPPDALPVPQFSFTIAHGTITGYRQGCRLECCRAAKRAEGRAYRARLRAMAGPDPGGNGGRPPAEPFPGPEPVPLPGEPEVPK